MTDTTADAAPARRFGGVALAVALMVSVAFALNVIAMKVVVDATSPLTSVAVRMSVTFLLCLPWFRAVEGRTRALALYGALNGGIFLVVMNVALSMANNVGALAIAGQLSVPCSLLLGALIFGERLTVARIAGVVLAFGGVALLVFDPAITHEIPAVLVMALAALCWAAGTLVQRRLTGVRALNTQAWNGLMGAAILAPLALLFEWGRLSRLGQVDGVALAWFGFTVVGATVIGQGALAWLLARYPLGTVMPLMLSSPVLATLFSSLYFGTRITPVMIVGGLIAVAGVAIISFSPPAEIPPISEAD